MEKGMELKESLDRSYELALFTHRCKVQLVPLNLMINAKTGDDVLAFVRRWAETNNVHLFVLDWDKLDLKYVNDYENGFLKDLSEPNTVMYLENYTGIEF